MMSRINGLAIAFISAVTLFAGAAAAERPAKQRPSQITPTGAEDAVTAVEDDGTRNIDALTSESTDGLVIVERADGTQSIDLQGRFQHVLRAKHTADGKIDVSCDADAKAKDPKGKILKPWSPQRARTARLDVKPLKAPIVVAPKKAPALEVK